MEVMMKYKVIKVDINSNFYPERLRNISSPPKQLYCLGNLELLNYKNNIAIIGSRNCSSYGERAAKDFAFNLAKNNVCIVSGSAKGIDSFSHIGALNAKGRTIAVLGSGLDNIYPRENEKLFQESRAHRFGSYSCFSSFCCKKMEGKQRRYS